MKFDILDKKMRAFETSMDQRIIPDVYMVARLDGRGFTRLTKELLLLEKPFDVTFRDAMITTAKGLADCGFKVRYAYTESDEISLLLDRSENGFDRKTRKLGSILAGEASARFTLAMGAIGVFDCRIIPLPTDALVIDYFRWRAEDANRNALNAWCYWKLREKGFSVYDATSQLSGRSVSEKNEILFHLGINYNDLPAWQKRGVAFYYDMVEKTSFNPVKNEPVVSFKKQWKVDCDLPMNDAYDQLLKDVLQRE
ncbi:MAG TPA: tRNA(His) guanylyltransferase Thg1 family protein [Ohtaekwangia sp.]|uniref:tRNA(His) guanylyltransferase Thg1 family protein n=1 Tax=Ohtaekwangia sp. TaxID=2066019 RepID=UPI002F92996B